MLLRFCFVAGAAFVLSAQTTNQTPPPPPNIKVVQRVDYTPFFVPPIAKAPFTAVATLERGTEVTVAELARDAKGRTRVEMREPRQITINDPITGMRAVLTPKTLEAKIFPGIPSQAMIATLAQPPTGGEDLGLATIEGLTAHGYRYNDQAHWFSDQTDRPNYRETWFSDQLQLTIKSKSETPQGTTTFALTQITLTDPDDALFQIPAEYKQTSATSNSDSTLIRIRAQVSEANLIKHVDPTYPPLALAAKVAGTVDFSAVIGTDGLVKSVQLVKGHPLLANAAREAVLQWQYRPTLLNGTAVEVVMAVSVTFSLPTPSDRSTMPQTHD